MGTIVRTAPPPPPAPRMPFASSATSQTISVSWEVLSLDDSVDEDPMAPIEFEVKISCLEDLECVSAPPLYRRLQRVFRPPAQFKGLQMFTSYIFCVRARGRGGWSDWSEISEPVSTTNSWSKEEIVDVLMQRHGHTLGGVFCSFDLDCDGFLSPEDFISGLDRAGLQGVPEETKLEIFSEADEAGRGYITLREFTKCLGRAAAEAGKSLRTLASHVSKPKEERVSRVASLSPVVHRRSRATAPVSRPQRSGVSPAPRSLSPVPKLPTHGRDASVVTSMRRTGSTKMLRKSVSAKVLSFRCRGDVRDAQPELRSGTGECPTPP